MLQEDIATQKWRIRRAERRANVDEAEVDRLSDILGVMQEEQTACRKEIESLMAQQKLKRKALTIENQKNLKLAKTIVTSTDDGKQRTLLDTFETKTSATASSSVVAVTA